MVETAALERVKRCLDKGQRFVLTTHVNPDGDSLGSEAALANYLLDTGKDVYVFNSSPVPANYDFLDPDNKMQLYDSEQHREVLLTADYLIVLDISDWERLRYVGKDIRATSIPKICIDHHPQQEKFGDISLVDVNASSTGEIVFKLIKHCDGKITRPIAEALYTSILTDTGSFKFSNTNVDAFSISSELVQSGINTQWIYQQVYERQSMEKIKLLAYMLNNLNFEQGGKVVWFAISSQALERIGAKQYDTEGLSDFPRVIEGVEITIMFIEMEHERVKVSLRSKGRHVINKIAQKFGGGGHKYAAGILIEGQMDEYIPKILNEVSHLFKKGQPLTA